MRSRFVMAFPYRRCSPPSICMARRMVFCLFDQSHIVAPGQFCNKLLHNWLIRPSFGKSFHIAQVARREAAYFWECGVKILGEPLDDPCSPALPLLPGQNALPETPIKQYRFTVYGKRGFELRGLHSQLYFGEEISTADRQRRRAGCSRRIWAVATCRWPDNSLTPTMSLSLVRVISASISAPIRNPPS